jgi:hypothetical protein
MVAALTVVLAALALVATPATASSGSDRGHLRLTVTGVTDRPQESSWRCRLASDCTTKRLRALRRVLVRAADTGRACTQIYGGPEVVTVRGTILGERYRVRIARNDGCGIADYRELFSLLGREQPLARTTAP